MSTQISALPAASTLADVDLLAVYIKSGSTFAVKQMTVANAKTVFMAKSVYDPQGAGYISGDTESGHQGGLLSMDAGTAGIGGSVTTYGTDSGAGGSITTNGGSSSGADGGYISTNGSTESGGHIDTSSHVHAGGNIDTFGGADLDGGSINTSNGGGSIDTRASGSIQLGIAGTRTTVVGNASEGDKTLTLPNTTGTIIATTNSPMEGQIIKWVSGAATWVDLP